MSGYKLLEKWIYRKLRKTLKFGHADKWYMHTLYHVLRR